MPAGPRYSRRPGSASASSRSAPAPRRASQPSTCWGFVGFETNPRRERQLEAIAAAKALEVSTSRKPSIDAAEVRRLNEPRELDPIAIARGLEIGRASVHRLGAS